MMAKKASGWKRAALILLVLSLLLGVACAIYINDYYVADMAAIEAFGVSGAVTCTEGDGVPQITNEAQIRRTVSEIVGFVNK